MPCCNWNHQLPKELSLLLAALAIVLALRFLQKHFPKQDPLFIERLIISMSAGLLLLAAINKLIIEPAYAPLSIPFAISAFLISVLHPAYGTVKVSPSGHVLLQLLALGSLALISYTLLGPLGALIVAPPVLLFRSAKPRDKG